MIGRAITAILAKLAAAVAWIGKLFVAVFVALWEMGTDLGCWAFDGFMSIAATAANSLDVSALESYKTVWSSIPGPVMQALSVLRVGEASAIIVAAITIRLILQLIPFVRLGS